jgi:dihydrolipoamide dehydrogenase
MDVPAPAAGVVKSLGVKVGDKVSEGALLLTLETTAAEAPAPQPAATGPAPAAPSAPAAAKPAPAPQRAPAATATTRAADEYRGAVDIECQMVVIGSGPGGCSGAFRAADLGQRPC